MPSGIRILSERTAPWLATRTRRSWQERRLPEGSLLLLKAGCWPRNTPDLPLPEGKGFIGIGLDRSPQSLALLKRSGGDFGTVSRWRSPFRTLPHALYFSKDVAAQLSAQEPEASALALLRKRSLRIVHLSPLDVHFDPRPRALLAVTSLHIGGAEKIVTSLAEELNRRGTQTAVASIGEPTRASLPPPRFWYDLQDHDDSVAALHQSALSFGADLIHAHLLTGETLKALAERGWRLVVTLHNTREAWPEGTETLQPSDVALVLGCSRAVESQILESLTHRTVWNGIAPPANDAAGSTLRASHGIPEGDLVLVTLANVRPQKGFERLGAILAAIQTRFPERRCHLWMAGNGTDQLELVPGAKGFGLLEDPLPFLRSGDVMLCPSRHEGLSLSQLEALALGMPVVATDVGGAREVAGITRIPPDANPETFADAVMNALEQPRPQLPESFTLASMARRTAHLYRQVLKESPRPPSGIWLVTNNFFTGGAQSSARRLLMELQRRKITVQAAVVEEAPSQPSPGRVQLEQAGIPVFVAPSDRPPLLESVETLLSAIAETPPQAVLFWNLRPEFKIALADALLHTPVFDVSPGEMNLASLERYFLRPHPDLPYATTRDYGERLSGAVVKYAGERDRAEAAFGCPVCVIPNGLELPPLPTRASRQGIQFLTAARLSPDKRLEELLHALRAAMPRLPRGSQLHIAGGPDGGNLDYVKALKRSARDLPVVWHGEVAAMTSWLATGDVFVMISEPAGCPNASLEAMASGLPVIATDHGGMSEQIIEGVTGLLTPRSTPQKLAERMVQLATDAELRQRLGAAARSHVDAHFSLSRMADTYMRLIEGKF